METTSSTITRTISGDKAMRVLGYQPRVSVQESIERGVKWILEHQKDGLIRRTSLIYALYYFREVPFPSGSVVVAQIINIYNYFILLHTVICLMGW